MPKKVEIKQWSYGLLGSNNDFTHFYPIALKGCRGIVFTHVVWMGGWARVGS